MSGLCECGCGQPTVVSDKTITRLGWVKGKPRRFVHGHANRGRTWTAKRRAMGSRRSLDDIYEVDASGCWVCDVVDPNSGYGRYKGTYAHRVMYRERIGPIPEGMEIDHLCNNRSCVNPEHLEAVTHAENVARAARRRRE